MIFAAPMSLLLLAALGQFSSSSSAPAAPPQANSSAPGVTVQDKPTAGACNYTGSHTATIQLTVTPQGRPVDEAIAVSSGSKCLDAQALKTIAGYHFNPAMKNGQATESHIRIQVNYKRF